MIHSMPGSFPHKIIAAHKLIPFVFFFFFQDLSWSLGDNKWEKNITGTKADE